MLIRFDRVRNPVRVRWVTQVFPHFPIKLRVLSPLGIYSIGSWHIAMRGFGRVYIGKNVP